MEYLSENVERGIFLSKVIESEIVKWGIVEVGNKKEIVLWND